MAAPRNLLVIVADEHRRDAAGFMGHPVVRTPNLDALAARGAVFENAYTPSPICVPTRAALATGLPIHRTGHWDSAAPYAGTPRSWMHAVRETGAETISFGKLHFRSADDDNGFDREVLPMHVVGGVGWTVGLLRGPGEQYDATEELAADVGPGESEYTRYDRAVAEAAADWIENRGTDARPWAAFVSFVTPHYPLRAPAEFLRLYDGADIAPPISGTPQHPELRHIAGYFDYARHFDAPGVRAAQAAYFALCSFMDACVGRVLDALEASGRAGDTLVVYVSDHGEMLGDHGFWTKSVMYEASAGIPMIVAGPGVSAGRRVRTAASLFDVAATAADLFGAEAFAAGLPGSPLPALAAAPDDPDRVAFSEYHDGGSSTGFFMVRWDRWKYVHYAEGPPQLFDLAADPAERRDRGLADDAESVAARREGARRLRAICDPDEANARAFADQRRRIEELGGETACRERAFGHTPAPSVAAGITTA